jgi:NADPH:quinone reductase-like Zn-dependent oxidoreductase
MKAYVINEPGGPEKLVLTEIKTPTAKPRWVLIKVKAFGLNRSEWFTRRGDSPSVKFPRVLGIECVGEIAESINSQFKPGQKVAAIMGGMGRDFDGSYAEYVLVPENIVFPVRTQLDWKIFGALPEMVQTTHGSLYQALEIEKGQTLLIRGGTSSIGLCALELAKNAGLKIISTTRSEAKIDFLKKLGAADVVVDQAQIADEIRKQYPQGVDRVLELIGASTLLDSLKTVRRGGIVCMTGILGGKWELEHFAPMDAIPTAVKLTAYAGEATDLTSDALQQFLDIVERGEIKVPAMRTFPFTELQEAHRLMDSNQGNGKIVVMI